MIPRKPTQRKDDLYRGLASPPSLRSGRVESRADGAASTDGVATTMYGHFAVFDTWTHIRSYWEGDFLERIAKGAFKKTMTERRDLIRVQFDHGYDSFVGGAPLGAIDDLREDGEGAYYEVGLLDTDYNRNRIEPLLVGRLLDGRTAGSQLGASFRFGVLQDRWVMEPKKSDHNPDGLPERTITEVRLHEFGPVVFGAYADATAMARCLTDHYLAKRGESDSSADTMSALTPDGEPIASSVTDSAANDEPAPLRHSGIPLSLAQARRRRMTL